MEATILIILKALHTITNQCSINSYQNPLTLIMHNSDPAERRTPEIYFQKVHIRYVPPAYCDRKRHELLNIVDEKW